MSLGSRSLGSLKYTEHEMLLFVLVSKKYWKSEGMSYMRWREVLGVY